mgnify:CR=1 FL=1
MQAIMNFFAGFADFIGTIVDFIIDFFSDLVYVIGLLGSFVLYIPMYFSWLPVEVVALVAMGFSIVIIYMILNRK